MAAAEEENRPQASRIALLGNGEDHDLATTSQNDGSNMFIARSSSLFL